MKIDISFDVVKKIGICAVVALILLFSEVGYRFFIGAEIIQSWLEEYGILFLMCLVYAFARYKATRIAIIILFVLTTVGNNIHYHVYRSWLNGVNLYLSFVELSEAAHYGAGILFALLPGVVWGLLECLLVVGSVYVGKRMSCVGADAVLLIALVLFSCRYLSPSHLEQGMNPQQIYGRAKTAFLATGYCFGHEIPYNLFNLSMVPKYRNSVPKKISEPLVKNVILIMGESATSGHAGVFGYSRDTTPFLADVVKNKKGTVLPCYSAATMTVVSLPFFFNCIYRPNAQEQISSAETNIFRLAKEQGFETYWVSAQARNQMAMMASVGKRYIDVVRFPDSYGYDVTENIPDKNLRTYFNELAIVEQKNNLVVLHQRGSHGPYGELLTEKEKQVFGEKTICDRYDNTIFMTDALIEGIYDDLCKSGLNDWVLIYTSDHGQYVTGNVANQNTSQEDCYMVPLAVIPSPTVDIENVISEELGSSITSHYRVGCLIMRLLGYDSGGNRSDEVFVTRSQITGDAGFFHIKNGVAKFITPEKLQNYER